MIDFPKNEESQLEEIKKELNKIKNQQWIYMLCKEELKKQDNVIEYQYLLDMIEESKELKIDYEKYYEQKLILEKQDEVKAYQNILNIIEKNCKKALALKDRMETLNCDHPIWCLCHQENEKQVLVCKCIKCEQQKIGPLKNLNGYVLYKLQGNKIVGHTNEEYEIIKQEFDDLCDNFSEEKAVKTMMIKYRK